MSTIYLQSTSNNVIIQVPDNVPTAVCLTAVGANSLTPEARSQAIAAIQNMCGLGTAAEGKREIALELPPEVTGHGVVPERVAVLGLECFHFQPSVRNKEQRMMPKMLSNL